MKRPDTRHGRRGAPLAVAMTPMIDVVFLLLVFFLCTATFDEPEQNLAASLAVEPSAAGSGAATDDPPTLDDVTLVGEAFGNVTRWTLNGGRSTDDPAELTALLRELAAIERGLPITIDAGRAVPLREVVLAYDAARAAGFDRVLLAASAEAIEASP